MRGWAVQTALEIMVNSNDGMKGTFWNWLCSAEPQGLGTLLLGIGALVALCQTSGVMEKVLAAQKQAEAITGALDELKKQSGQVEDAVNLLALQLTELKAKQTVEASEVLKSNDATRQQIEDEINKILPTQPTQGTSSIYLPKSRLNDAIEGIYEQKRPEQRAAVLQGFLMYKSSVSPQSATDDSK